MSLSRVFYEPFYSLSDFDRLFEDAFSARTSGNGGQGQAVQRHGGGIVPKSLRPRMDIHEDPKSNKVTATFELPGLKKEDVNIDVHDNLLTISGESKTSEERDEGDYAVRERHYGKFSRTIPVPQGIKEQEVKASLENGVLTVTYPKTTPEQAPKKITIS